MSVMQSVKEFWADPQKRKLIITCSVLLGAYYLAPLFFTSSHKAEQLKPMEKNTDLFAVAAVDDMDAKKNKAVLDQIAADSQNREVAAAQREQQTKKQNERMEKELAQVRMQMNEVTQFQNQLKQMIQGGKFNTMPAPGDAEKDKDGNTVIRHDPNTVQVVEKPQTQTITREPLIRGSMLRTVTQGKVRQVKETGKIEEKDVQLVAVSEDSQKVDNLSPKKKADPNAAQNNTNKDDEGTWLSAGSIITGTLLNGVDAPTAGTQQSKMPMPVVIRIKKEALMANNYTMDLRECVIIGTAIGDLATSRAYIRAETLSCNTEDAKAIEVPLTAYAVGRDGKNGIDGQLVSKSGGMLKNAMVAGLLSGFSAAASPSSVNVLNTNPTSESLFQRQNIQAMSETAAFKGTSTAFDMMAKYYLQLVDASWPVVEVLGGREIDFIVQKGIPLKING